MVATRMTNDIGMETWKMTRDNVENDQGMIISFLLLVFFHFHFFTKAALVVLLLSWKNYDSNPLSLFSQSEYNGQIPSHPKASNGQRFPYPALK